MPKIMDFDTALEHIGEFGRHQKKVYFLVSLVFLPLSTQMLIFVFVGAVPEWKCPSPRGNILHCNSTHPACCDKDGSICHGAEFTSEFTCIATEWNLACGDRYKSELSQSIFVAGHMFGGVIFGILSDKYGRRNPWLFACLGGSILALLSGLVATYEQYMVLRFIIGAFNGGGGLVTYVLATETVGPAYRASAGTWQHSVYNVGYVLLAFEAYFIRNWRTLTVISILPSFIIMWLVKFIPESPRWLASSGRTKEAQNTLRKIEEDNGYQKSEEIFLNTASKHSTVDGKASQYGIMDLFTHRSSCIITVVMMLIWCVNSMVYYGLALNVKNLGGNLYINFTLASLIDLPSCFAAQFLLSRIGRRLSLFFLLLGGSFSCLLCMLLQFQGGNNVAAVSITALGGRFCIFASFAVLYVYSAELFPTVVRNAGLGVSSLSARVGGIVAPFIVLLGDRIILLPMFVFTCTALFAGLVGLTLHETQGKPMPETFEDLQRNHLRSGKNNSIRLNEL